MDSEVEPGCLWGETVLERGLWRWSKAAARVGLVIHKFHLFLKVYKLRIV